MLVDPVAVAASAPNPAFSFSIVNADNYGSERRDLTSGVYDLKINHGKLKDGERHYMQMLQSKDVTDPYTGAIRRKQASVSLSVSWPTGFTLTEMVNLIKAHADTLADADVTPTKLLQWQS
jgi:hypothetical protein